MNYKTLKYLLAAGKWKEADNETRRVLLKVAKREQEVWLDAESIDNFPRKDLCALDQLWVHYSKERFGFSIQKRIYQGLGGTRKFDGEIWQNFGDAIGWRVNGKWLYSFDVIFSLSAPEGHLPFWAGCGGVECGMALLSHQDL